MLAKSCHVPMCLTNLVTMVSLICKEPLASFYYHVMSLPHVYHSVGFLKSRVWSRDAPFALYSSTETFVYWRSLKYLTIISAGIHQLKPS
jgi:hypothetical protein